MKLPGAQVFVPKDRRVSPAIENRVTRYPRGSTPEETLENRNKAVRDFFQEIGIPLRKVSFDNWTDHGVRLGDPGYGALAAHLAPGHEVHFGRHMNSPSGEWEIATSQLLSCLKAWQNGQRTYQNDYGVALPLSDRMTAKAEKLAEFVKERENRNADPKAISFFKRQQQSFVKEVNEALWPCRLREALETLPGVYYVHDMREPHSHPGEAITREFFLNRALNGEFTPHHLIWRDTGKEINPWVPYDGSPEQMLSDRLQAKRPTARKEKDRAKPLAGRSRPCVT